MSNRDDSFLYTGMTSATADHKPTPRELQREQKEQDRLKLKGDAAEVVLEAIAKERDNVTDIRSFIVDRKDTPEDINVELRARKLYLGYLNTLEVKIKGIVKIQPSRKRKSAEVSHD
jgi:hypothetical protein